MLLFDWSDLGDASTLMQDCCWQRMCKDDGHVCLGGLVFEGLVCAVHSVVSCACCMFPPWTSLPFYASHYCLTHQSQVWTALELYIYTKHPDQTILNLSSVENCEGAAIGNRECCFMLHPAGLSCVIRLHWSKNVALWPLVQGLGIDEWIWPVLCSTYWV